MIKAEVIGVDRTVSFINNLSLAVKANLSKVVVKTAYNIEAETKQDTPVDTGRARSSVHVEGFGALNYLYSADGKSFNGSFTEKAIDQFEAYVGSNVEYFLYLEDGTYNEDGTPIMLGKHMLRNATQKNIPSFRAEVINALK